MKGKVIAILEDDGVIADAYTQTLLAHGASVVVLSEVDSELLVQLASINHIDCILSDYRLKYTTGDVLIQTLREHFNQEIPALIVTAPAQ
mgnify:CR=1 FL=1